MLQLPTSKSLNLAIANVGDTANLKQIITEEFVAEFARISGDYNPVHMDLEFARGSGFRHRVVHGMITASLASQVVGMQLPGPGALWTEQQFRWPMPVFIGDCLDVQVTVTGRSPAIQAFSISVKAVNQDGRTVMEGNGTVRLLERRDIVRTVPISERAALVTGGSRGIGASIAKTLAMAGAKVTILSREPLDDPNALCQRVFDEGTTGFATYGNVTDPESLRRAITMAGEHFGQPIDVLVNCAGKPFQPTAFADSSWPEWQSQMDVQLQGAFHAVQAVLPGMIARGSGSIVNIGSTYAWGAPPPQWIGFAAAKAALKAMTHGLAVEFASKSIRVNMVSADLVETEFALSLPDRIRKLQAMQTPMRRLARVEEIAEAVKFLCSEGSEFITGVDLPVCGGLAM